MAEADAYPHQRLYGAFVHRELSLAWIKQALLLAGQHRFELAEARGADGQPAFNCLEFGCGHGLNLILNAAAHPEGQFYGVDLNPSHVAGATARAADLGLANVRFARADLRSFAAGRPRRGPAADWPEQVDLVLAHGVAAWVSPAVRQALVAAAAALLRPGGVFLCSYNTYPGWLSSSPLAMLCQEQALRAGGVASAALIRATAQRLEGFLGSPDHPLPLGAAQPSLRSVLARIPSAPEGYLEGEFHAALQPLYVGPMHRLCAAHGLTPVGSATLPELFPSMLDPARRELLEQAEDPALREVLFDLAIQQSFRRDLFAFGVRPPAASWRQQALAALPVLLRSGTWPEDAGFDTSLGRVGLNPDFCAALRQALETAPLTLGVLAESAEVPLDELLPRMAVLLNSGLISLGDPAGAAAGPTWDQQATTAFNDRVVERTSAGDPLGWLLSPVLRQPVRITPEQALFRQLLDLPLAAAEVAELVALGLSQAGGRFRDQAGQPLEDPAEVIPQLITAWERFRTDQVPEWRRLGLLPPDDISSA